MPDIANTVSFTGTQSGMTKAQKAAVIFQMCYLRNLGYLGAIHGDCIGADADFHEIARHNTFWIETYPGTDANGLSPKRAHCQADLIHDAAPYLIRNQQMIDASAILIACPGEMTEQIRSGTWSTVRKGRRSNVFLIMILPDGSVPELP